MHCAHCEFDNPEGMNFCGKCGAKLSPRCTQCDFENPPGFQFCGKCGASLTQQPASTSTQGNDQQQVQQDQPPQAESPPSEPHAPDAERRQLTVMFCDLVGSTALSSQFDPEDYREVVREYQKTCTQVIERFDGYVAQYLGDGLLVYFGYPKSHEDEAQRAVYTGLGILDAMNQLNGRLEQDKDIHLALRVGIHTGSVVENDTKRLGSLA